MGSCYRSLESLLLPIRLIIYTDVFFIVSIRHKADDAENTFGT